MGNFLSKSRNPYNNHLTPLKASPANSPSMIAQNAIFSNKLERNTSKNIAHTEQKTNGESFLPTSPAMPLRFALDLRHQAWPLKKIPAQSKGLVTKFFLAVK